ncbi:hypothetical protein ACFX2H_038524 [Malus domestica]
MCVVVQPAMGKSKTGEYLCPATFPFNLIEQLVCNMLSCFVYCLVEPKTLQDANFLKGSVKDFINRLEAEPTMREQKGSKHVRNSGCGRKKLVPCYF